MQYSLLYGWLRYSKAFGLGGAVNTGFERCYSLTDLMTMVFIEPTSLNKFKEITFRLEMYAMSEKIY